MLYFTLLYIERCIFANWLKVKTSLFIEIMGLAQVLWFTLTKWYIRILKHSFTLLKVEES